MTIGSATSIDLNDDDLVVEYRSNASPFSTIHDLMFAGYAGWGPGQLEAELGEEAWYVEPALPGDVFASPGARLWNGVLRRMGGRYRLVATMPDDPGLN